MEMTRLSITLDDLSSNSGMALDSLLILNAKTYHRPSAYQRRIKRALARVFRILYWSCLNDRGNVEVMKRTFIIDAVKTR